MNRIVCTFFLLFVYGAGVSAQTIQVWRTSEEGRFSMTADDPLPWMPSMPDSGKNTIEIDPSIGYESIIGLGASFDHATCYNLSLLEPRLMEDAIAKIVDPVSGIGMNLMRICMGTPDFTPEPWYSYDDVPPGQTDPELKAFSIEKDKKYILPVLKLALRINPNLLFFASPWSPPAWMKDNGSMLAGKIKPEYYAVYAQYFVKFIQAYMAEGIPIYAVTPQNEPDFPNPHYPTCFWTGEEERDFIRDHLGPAFQNAGIKTLIWGLDHNWNLLHFARAILTDASAAAFVDGIGFHLYEGKPESQMVLKKEFPDKQIYFTEGSVFGTRGAIELIQILGNGSRSYNAWVMMLDEKRKPNNGPHDASQTAMELLENQNVRYNYDYYMYGQFMKFIGRGAVRVHTLNTHKNIAGIAYKNSDGKMVLIVVNNTKNPQKFRVGVSSSTFNDTAPIKSISTYTWR